METACEVCFSIYKTSLCLSAAFEEMLWMLCVCVSRWDSASLAAQLKETKTRVGSALSTPGRPPRSTAALHRRAPFTCWSSHNYGGQPHPSPYCCAVRPGRSFSGSVVLHKETITKSKQVPTEGGRRQHWERKWCRKKKTGFFFTHSVSFHSSTAERFLPCNYNWFAVKIRFAI